MTAKQKAKHLTDAAAKILTPEKSSLEAAEPTPDGLGPWEGGTAALKGANNWVSLKSRATRFADAKRAPGTEYAKKVVDVTPTAA